MITYQPGQSKAVGIGAVRAGIAHDGGTRIEILAGSVPELSEQNYQEGFEGLTVDRIILVQIGLGKKCRPCQKK
jgi:hypothetical protein